MKDNVDIREIFSRNKTVNQEFINEYAYLSAYELVNLLLLEYPSEEILMQLSDYLNLPHTDSDNISIDRNFFNSFDLDTLVEWQIVPVYEDSQSVCFGCSNPFHPHFNQLKGDKELRLILLNDFDLHKILGRQYQNDAKYFLDIILKRAFSRKASDIHIIPQKDKIIVNFRVFGQVYPVLSLNLDKKEVLSNIIKLHAQMKTDLSLMPQDGRMYYEFEGKSYHIRVSSLPTFYGESFSLRVFYLTQNHFDITRLGLLEESQSLIKTMLNKNSGLILVTGPTNSGKSTTLYSFLNHIRKNTKKNIITIEDPVEYVFDGILQAPVNGTSGFSFERALRAIFRMDPDVIMVGEIRDYETAKIALDAAYTGHLVFASLHTSDIYSTLDRLKTFNLDPYLIINALRGIISQKLVAKNCPKCTIKHEEEAYYYSPGCPDCKYLKYSGSIPIIEILDIYENHQVYTDNFDTSNIIKNNQYYSFEYDTRLKMDQGLVSKINVEKVI